MHDLLHFLHAHLAHGLALVLVLPCLGFLDAFGDKSQRSTAVTQSWANSNNSATSVNNTTDNAGNTTLNFGTGAGAGGGGALSDNLPIIVGGVVLVAALMFLNRKG